MKAQEGEITTKRTVRYCVMYFFSHRVHCVTDIALQLFIQKKCFDDERCVAGTAAGFRRPGEDGPSRTVKLRRGYHVYLGPWYLLRSRSRCRNRISRYYLIVSLTVYQCFPRSTGLPAIHCPSFSFSSSSVLNIIQNLRLYMRMYPLNCILNYHVRM